MEDPKIVIVNLGSQVTSNIERSLREIGFRSAVLPPKQAETWIKNKLPKAIILSGGPDSVNNTGARTIGEWMFDIHTPILGICYGMQLTAKILGGEVVSTSALSEYGPAEITLGSSEIFQRVPKQATKVWASHSDTVKVLPKGFVSTAKSNYGHIMAMENRERRIWGVQFHPEMTQTTCGKQILANFIGEIAGCQQDWHPKDMVAEIQGQIREEVGDSCVMLGFSGGRDSTTLAAIASPILGIKLRGVCIDGNQLRENELSEIRANAAFAKISLLLLSVRREFMREWKRHSKQFPDPEVKRKVFIMLYTKFLTEALRRLGIPIKFFMQGTLAPDWIESGQTGGDIIKSHHNVGIEIPGCKSLHPLKHLFKYEITALGELIGLPSSVTQRPPSPGPGLVIRTLHGWPTWENTKILRWADKTAIDVMKNLGIHDKISQPVVAFDCNKYVGVKGDERVYGHAILIRTPITDDYMTAHTFRFSEQEFDAIDSALTRHPKIVHTLLSYTPKPPGTIEFE